jgi:hypothetical protein
MSMKSYATTVVGPTVLGNARWHLENRTEFAYEVFHERRLEYRSAGCSCGSFFDAIRCRQFQAAVDMALARARNPKQQILPKWEE